MIPAASSLCVIECDHSGCSDNSSFTVFSISYSWIMSWIMLTYDTQINWSFWFLFRFSLGCHFFGLKCHMNAIVWMIDSLICFRECFTFSYNKRDRLIIISRKDQDPCLKIQGFNQVKQSDYTKVISDNRISTFFIYPILCFKTKDLQN